MSRIYAIISITIFRDDPDLMNKVLFCSDNRICMNVSAAAAVSETSCISECVMEWHCVE